MKYKAVLFDMDGTILDTVLDIYDCVNIYLEKFGYSRKSMNDVRHAMGGGANALVHKMLPENINEEDFQAFFSEYIPYYETHGKDKTAPYPGILKLLNDLKAQGTKLVVVSSKPHNGVVSLCEHYFNGIFDIALGDKLDGKMKLKPAPDYLYYALDQLGISKKDAIYVGDSEFDIKVAQNAEMAGVVVTWGYRDFDELALLNPQYTANTIEELRKILL